MRSLNRLKWLHAFEAAARHGSFTGAAEELGVTPAAVGQQVRSLEEWVGHPLLHRTRSGKERLSLVAEAKEALQDITSGLDSLEQGLNKLRGARARAVVVITASQVLMMNWLMERLNRFSEQHDSIDLRLNVTEKLTDVLHGEADVGIRCGPGNWPGLQSTWLMDEEAVIVCSPQLLGGVTEADWLSKQKLIFDDTPHPGADFPTWERILANIGVPASQQNGLHINSTSAVILAALSGRGVAVVRKALVQQLIEHGQLRQLFPQHKWPLRWSYFIVRSERSTRRQEVSLFHDWLVADVGATIK
ncbi:LysR substrate-binding domain-containing protein [Cedecea davisae]|uniref:LysR substrate-binding domain-containing protein n=1 Tax=Cedecea davisae TaxID=158484 RepID=UPI00242BFA31|nr:LysR substrate-binding domain-containing protein [Cedecea davisae]